MNLTFSPRALTASVVTSFCGCMRRTISVQYFVYHALPELLCPRVLDVGKVVRAVAEERLAVSVLEAVAQENGYAVHLAWRERWLEADV